MLLRTAIQALISTSGRVFANAGVIIVLARMLPPDQFGTICLSLSWCAVIGILADWGLAHSAWYGLIGRPEAAHHRLRQDFATRGALTVAYFAAAAIVFVVFMHETHALVFWGIAVAIYLTQQGEYLSFVLRALRPAGVEASLSSSLSAFYAVGVIGAALVTRSEAGVVVAMVVTRLVYVAATGFVVFGAVRGIAAGEGGGCYRGGRIVAELRANFPVAADVSLMILASQIDVLLVGALLQRDVVGIYAAGGRLVMASTILTATITILFVPYVVSNRNSPEVRGRQTGYLFLSVMLLGLAAFIGFCVFGPLMVRYLYGAAYADLNRYWPLFGILVWVQFWAAGFGILLNSYARQRDRAIVQAIVLPLIALVAWATVPQSGIPAMIVVMIGGGVATGFGCLSCAGKAGLLDRVPRAITVAMVTMGPALLLLAAGCFAWL